MSNFLDRIKIWFLFPFPSLEYHQLITLLRTYNLTKKSVDHLLLPLFNNHLKKQFVFLSVSNISKHPLHCLLARRVFFSFLSPWNLSVCLYPEAFNHQYYTSTLYICWQWSYSHFYFYEFWHHWRNLGAQDRNWKTQRWRSGTGFKSKLKCRGCFNMHLLM